MELIEIFDRVLVREFYRANAGFFLLVILLAFGFMSGVEHRALAEFFVSSHTIMLIPSALWLLYAIKIINFNRQRVNFQENRFLFHIMFLTRGLRLRILALTFLSQFMPAIAYSGFLILIAMKHGLFLLIAQIVFTQMLAILIGTISLQRHILHAPEEIKVSALKHFIDTHFSRPLLQFYIEWIMRNEIFLFIGTKVFTGLLLFGVTQLYKGETYDWRLMAMGTTAAYSGNFMLITSVHRFENMKFNLLHGLPFSLGRRLQTYLIVFTTLTLPEFIVLLRNFPENLSNIHLITLTLFGISIGLLFYSLHFINSFFEKDLTRFIFLGVILWIVLILFSVPVSILMLLNCIAGILVYSRTFYKFEYSEISETDTK